MATYNHQISYGDVQITSESGLQNMPTVTYGGRAIKDSFVGNCTIPCAGKYMTTNIVVGGKTLQCANKIMSYDVAIYAYGVVGVKPATTASRTYNGSAQDNGYATPSHVVMTGNNSGTNVGTYVATYTPEAGYFWSDGTNTSVTVTMTMNALSISNAVVNLGASITYNGSAQTQSVSSVLVGSLYATYSVTGNVQTNAGNYTLRVSGTGNYTGYKDVSWSLAQRAIDVFTLNATSLTFNGSAQSVSVASCKGNGIDATYSMSGTWSATNVGSYTATVSGTGNFTGTMSVEWTMNVLYLAVPTLENTSMTYNGDVQAPTVNGFNSAFETQGGIASATNAGNYAVTWSLNSTTNTKWIDGTVATKSESWDIAKASGWVSLNTGTASVNAGYSVSISVVSSHGGTISASSSSGSAITSVSGSTVTLRGISAGSSTITVVSEATENYYEASATCALTIVQPVTTFYIDYKKWTTYGTFYGWQTYRFNELPCTWDAMFARFGTIYGVENPSNYSVYRGYSGISYIPRTKVEYGAGDIGFNYSVIGYSPSGYIAVTGMQTLSSVIENGHVYYARVDLNTDY